MGGKASPNTIVAGELEIRPDEGLVTAASQALLFSVREFDLLVVLAAEPGRIFRRDELYREIWGAPLRQGDRTIDVYVRRLRVKLADALPGWTFIHTHVGFGYRFAAESQTRGTAPRDGVSPSVHMTLTAP